MTKEESTALKQKIVEGKNINLRIASEKDAEFILKLRLNPDLNKFIGKTDPSLIAQRQWINKAVKNISDFHFIIENKNGRSFGTIAVYNIDFVNGLAEWGRWIIKPNAPILVSIESSILLLEFAFKKLKLKMLHGGANNLNWQVVKFHMSYANISSEDQTHTWFTFEESNLNVLKRKYGKLIN